MDKNNFGINPKEKKGVAPSNQTNATPFVSNSEVLNMGTSVLDKGTQIFVFSETNRIQLLVAVLNLQNQYRCWLATSIGENLRTELLLHQYHLEELQGKLEKGGMYDKSK